MLLSALRVAVATPPMVLLCASQSKHFPMSFPFENGSTSSSKGIFYLFDESQDWILLPSSIRPLVDLFKEVYKIGESDRSRASAFA